MQVSTVIGQGEENKSTTGICRNSVEEAERLERDCESAQGIIEVRL